MSKVDEINKLVESNIDDVYRASVSRIISDLNRENRLMQDYNGRQIFELLQNADDCGEGDSRDVRIKFEIVSDDKGTLLAVMNTGKPFSVEGIKSLLVSDVSSKRNVETIGYMGLGFRSVLNWTSDITIVTRDFTATFSEKAATEKLKKYIEIFEGNLSADDSSVLDGVERTAILASCRAVDTEEKYIERWLGGDFVTAILLRCNEEQIKEATKELGELQQEELIFLKHIKEVDIGGQSDARKMTAFETCVSDGEYRIYTAEEPEGDSSEWRVWKKQGRIEVSDGDDKADKFEIALAYNTDIDKRLDIRDKTGRLYSYFVTDIRMPFPILIHGDFALTSNRRMLSPNSKKNRYVFGEIEDFMIETAEKIKSSHEECDYTALSVLISNERYESGNLKEYGYDFFAELKRKINGLKLLPSINGEYLSLDDKPRYSAQYIEDEGQEGKKTRTYFADILNKESFDHLLKRCGDSVVSKYIGDRVKMYDIHNLVDLVNENAEEYIANKSYVKLVRLLYGYLQSSGLSKFYSSIPHLLVEDDVSKVYICSGSSFNESLPTWADVKIMDPGTKGNLLPYFGPDEHSMAEKLSAFGCREYNIHEIVCALIDGAKKDAGRIRDLLRWLYEFWKRDREQFLKVSLAGLSVVSREDEIVEATECYIGGEYGYDTEEKITGCIKGARYLASIEKLGMAVSDEGDFKAFLHAIGLCELPRFRLREITKRGCPDYFEYVCSHGYEEIKSWLNVEICVYSPEGLEDILKNANFADIVYWLYKLSESDVTRRYIDEEFEWNGSHIRGNTNKRYYSNMSIDGSHVPSWFRYNLATTPWIPADGDKHDFSECTINPNGFEPHIKSLNSVDFEAKNGAKVSSNDLAALFERIGMPKNIVDLPKQALYRLLSNLHDLNLKREDDQGDCKDVVGLYRNMEEKYTADSKDYNLNDLIRDNAEYDDFISKGYILAKIRGGYRYLPAKEVYYIGKMADFSEDILYDYPLIPIPRKRGEEKIAQMFGVSRFRDVEVTLSSPVWHSLSESGKYEEEFKSKLPYVYATRLKAAPRNEDLNLLRDLKVVLLRGAKISVKLKDDVDGEADSESVPATPGKDLGEYKFVNEKSKRIAYIRVPESVDTIEKLRNDANYLFAITDVVSSFLESASETDTYSFIFSHSDEMNEGYFSGDDYLSCLEDARRRFDSSDPENDFWSKVAKAAGREAEEIKNIYKPGMSSSFAFDNLKSLDLNDGESVRRMFIELGVDVAEFNRYTYNRVDFARINDLAFRSYKNKYKKNYQYWVAFHLSHDVENSDKTIGDYRSKMADYDQYKCSDDLLFDPEAEFKKAYGIETDELPDVGEDLEDLIDELSARASRRAESELDAETKNLTLPSESVEEVSGGLNRMEATERTDSTSPKVYVMELTDSPSKDTSPSARRGGAPHGTRGVYNLETEERRKNDGLNAEREVYGELLEWERKGLIKDLRWVSGNAETYNPKSADVIGDDCGYDISYVDENGIQHFVDVKGSVADSIDFKLSQNEYNVGMEKSGEAETAYDIWFVFLDKRSGKAKTMYIINDFFKFDEKEDFFKNKKYSVQFESFDVSMNKTMVPKLLTSDGGEANSMGSDSEE